MLLLSLFGIRFKSSQEAALTKYLPVWKPLLWCFFFVLFFKKNKSKCLIPVYFQLLLMCPVAVSNSLLLKDASAGRGVLDGGQALCLLCHLGGPNKQTCKDVEKADGKSPLSPNRGRVLVGRTFPSLQELRTSRANWPQSDGPPSKLSLRFDGKSGSSANCVFNHLLPANKRKTSLASRSDCFSLWRQKWKFCNYFWYKDSRREWI